MKDRDHYWVVVPKSQKREPFMLKEKNASRVWERIREEVGGAEIEDVIHLCDVLDARDLVESIRDFGRSLGFRSVQ